MTKRGTDGKITSPDDAPCEEKKDCKLNPQSDKSSQGDTANIGLQLKPCIEVVQETGWLLWKWVVSYEK